MAPQQATAPRSGNIVVVGCKLPHGLIVDLYRPSTNESGQKVMAALGNPVTFKGANSSNIIGGYGLTEVDGEFWDAWIKQNPTFAPVKAGLIFMQDRRDKAMDQAMDQAEARTGFEGIDPEKPGRGIQPVPKKELQAIAAAA